jgi:8-oxo-dGTP pyrophosphatase MutT (NUDIX family)
MMAVVPQKAATVILLRDKNNEGFEVFLLKRHEKSSFMGGNFVYPGGRVDRDDGSLESFAHWIAAIRELFEEAGVLLAYDQKGNLFQLRNPDDQRKFLNYRESLQKGKISICEMAQKEKLLLALDQLHYYAHWITPEARSERFDTRFFLAHYPLGQEASHDQKETTAGVWITPQKALKKNLKGEAILSPPTLKTLEDLSRFKSIDDVFDSLRRQEVQPILPILTKISDNPLIIFPWDPEYDLFQKGEIPSPVNHGHLSQPGDNTTRLILKEGIWHPYCRTN